MKNSLVTNVKNIFRINEDKRQKAKEKKIMKKTGTHTLV